MGWARQLFSAPRQVTPGQISAGNCCCRCLAVSSATSVPCSDAFSSAYSLAVNSPILKKPLRPHLLSSQCLLFCNLDSKNASKDLPPHHLVVFHLLGRAVVTGGADDHPFACLFFWFFP